MSDRTRGVCLGVLAAMLGTAAAAAVAADPTAEELQAQIEQLRQKVDELQARQISAKEVDAIVQRVMSDASRRSQLLDPMGFTAGYDARQGGFILQSANGDFRLNPSVQFQFRSVTNFREGTGDNDDDTENGFEISRLKLRLEGNAFGHDLTYAFQWTTDLNEQSDGDPANGSPRLQDAWVQYKFADDWAMRAGQYKDPVFHEELTSSRNQMAVDRSLLNEYLGGGETDYVQGFSLLFDNGGGFRAHAMLHDGYNSDNTTFMESGGSALLGGNPDNWGVALRMEFMLLGEATKNAWRQYDDFSAMGNTQDILVIGGGFDLSQGGGHNILFHTIDVQFENTRGLSLYAAYVAAYRKFDDVGADSFYDWGFMLQASYMLDKKWEFFGRYDMTFFDDSAPGFSGDDMISEITAGVNYYFQGHRAKVTIDLTWLPDGSPTNENTIGVLAGDGNQVILRGQFQLLL